jgi:hypothetical protein
MAATYAARRDDLSIPVGYFDGFGGAGPYASKAKVAFVFVGQYQLSHRDGILPNLIVLGGIKKPIEYVEHIVGVYIFEQLVVDFHYRAVLAMVGA